jgi:hypothetical protein
MAIPRRLVTPDFCANASNKGKQLQCLAALDNKTRASIHRYQGLKQSDRDLSIIALD